MLYPRSCFDSQVQGHGKKALSAHDGAKLPDADVRGVVRAEGDEEDDERLVHGVRHVDPERIRLVHLAQTTLLVQMGI